jgi:hypothetical protein
MISRPARFRAEKAPDRVYRDVAPQLGESMAGRDRPTSFRCGAGGARAGRAETVAARGPARPSRLSAPHRQPRRVRANVSFRMGDHVDLALRSASPGTWRHARGTALQAGGHRFDPGTLHTENRCKRPVSSFSLGRTSRCARLDGNHFGTITTPNAAVEAPERRQDATRARTPSLLRAVIPLRAQLPARGR